MTDDPREENPGVSGLQGSSMKHLGRWPRCCVGPARQKRGAWIRIGILLQNPTACIPRIAKVVAPFDIARMRVRAGGHASRRGQARVSQLLPIERTTMTCTHFAKEQVLFREGDPADSVFRILSGSVDIRRERDGDSIL